MANIVEIWRSPVNDEWCHRFRHQNGNELSRQSETVKRRATAVKSATVSYFLGELVPHETDEHLDIFRSSARPDVVVWLWKSGARIAR